MLGTVAMADELTCSLDFCRTFKCPFVPSTSYYQWFAKRFGQHQNWSSSLNSEAELASAASLKYLLYKFTM
jgi:hypothetical protein